MTITLPWMPSPNFYAGRPNPIQVLVMHSVEGPMTAGLAKSLAGPNWFGSTKAGTSANAIFDQTGGYEMVKPTDRAWHVGGGNNFAYGTEHCGYAAFSADQWLTADGKKMLTASALWNRQLADSLGIPWKRVTVAEIQAGARGLCTHNDCRLVWGGTTHTDPQWADEVWNFYLAAGEPAQPPSNEGDDMPLSQADKDWITTAIRNEVKRGLGNDYDNADPGKVIAAGPPSERAYLKVQQSGSVVRSIGRKLGVVK